jgi:hypothetical protein
MFKYLGHDFVPKSKNQFNKYHKDRGHYFCKHCDLKVFKFNDLFFNKTTHTKINNICNFKNSNFNVN